MLLDNNRTTWNHNFIPNSERLVRVTAGLIDGQTFSFCFDELPGCRVRLSDDVRRPR